MSRKPSLVRYIEQRRSAGRSEQEIRNELLDAGWQMDIVMRSMQTNMYTARDNQVIPQTTGRLQKSTEMVKIHVARAGKKIAAKAGRGKKARKPIQKPHKK